MPHPKFSRFYDLISYLFESFKEEIEENKEYYETWQEHYEDMLEHRINDDCAYAYYGFEIDFNASEICNMFNCFNDYDIEINWENTDKFQLHNTIIYYVWRDCNEDIEDCFKE